MGKVFYKRVHGRSEAGKVLCGWSLAHWHWNWTWDFAKVTCERCKKSLEYRKWLVGSET